MAWFRHLSSTRRQPKTISEADSAVCTTFKPLPAAPESDATIVDFVCTIVSCADVKVDNSTNLFKPRQVVVKRKVLISVPSKSDYISAMAVIEQEAVKIFGELASRGVSEGECGVEGAKLDIRKMLRSEALVKTGQKDLHDGVGMNKENWESALRLLGKAKAPWELLVAFHESPVVDKKQELKWPKCFMQ